MSAHVDSSYEGDLLRLLRRVVHARVPTKLEGGAREPTTSIAAAIKRRLRQTLESVVGLEVQSGRGCNRAVAAKTARLLTTLLTG